MTMMLINMWYIILVIKQKLELGRCCDQTIEKFSHTKEALIRN